MSAPNYQEMLLRIRGQQTKSAADNEALNMKDPADKGTVTPPNHPDGDSDSKKQIPPSATNTDGQEGKDITDKDTNPSSTGCHVPGPVTNGKSKDDAATSPDVALNKIAGEVGSILDRITALRTPSKAATATPKAASGDDEGKSLAIQLTPEFHMKLAAAILEDEEGMQFAEQILRKAAGQEKAHELINAALQQQHSYNAAVEEYEQEVKQANDAQAQDEAAFAHALAQATPEELAQIEKAASVHNAYLSSFSTEYERAAYRDGVMKAAAMEENMAAMPPEAAPAMPGEMPPGPEGGEGGEAPMGVEEIIALLEEMVQAGEISEEEAMQVAQALLEGEGGGGGMEGGAPEGEMPLPEDAPPEAKMASALYAQFKSH
jgi:hypothetical protein